MDKGVPTLSDVTTDELSSSLAEVFGSNPVTDPDRPAAEGGPHMLQVLTPEGERVPSPELDPLLSDLSVEDLRGFYRDLVLIRRVDAEATALQRQVEGLPRGTAQAGNPGRAR